MDSAEVAEPRLARTTASATKSHALTVALAPCLHARSSRAVRSFPAAAPATSPGRVFPRIARLHADEARPLTDERETAELPRPLAPDPCVSPTKGLVLSPSQCQDCEKHSASARMTTPERVGQRSSRTAGLVSAEGPTYDGDSASSRSRSIGAVRGLRRTTLGKRRESWPRELVFFQDSVGEARVRVKI